MTGLPALARGASDGKVSAPIVSPSTSWGASPRLYWIEDTVVAAAAATAMTGAGGERAPSLTGAAGVIGDLSGAASGTDAITMALLAASIRLLNCCCLASLASIRLAAETPPPPELFRCCITARLIVAPSDLALTSAAGDL